MELSKSGAVKLTVVSVAAAVLCLVSLVVLGCQIYGYLCFNDDAYDLKIKERREKIASIENIISNRNERIAQSENKYREFQRLTNEIARVEKLQKDLEKDINGKSNELNRLEWAIELTNHVLKVSLGEKHNLEEKLQILEDSTNTLAQAILGFKNEEKSWRKKLDAATNAVARAKEECRRINEAAAADRAEIMTNAIKEAHAQWRNKWKLFEHEARESFAGETNRMTVVLNGMMEKVEKAQSAANSIIADAENEGRRKTEQLLEKARKDVESEWRLYHDKTNELQQCIRKLELERAAKQKAVRQLSNQFTVLTNDIATAAARLLAARQQMEAYKIKPLDSSSKTNSVDAVSIEP